ncbi:sensor histidine kinase [Duganella violaceipulchra]|uniref:histidine kinase n=1 Tax=Duganella violaceipulchra TaxID=2849652 RepID=A0AA41HIB0_9BURK|nr:ATP-binding protein [Duganella violaceicalia]MBV6324323.1 response regulator [Duganella violaceicalia]MCP2007286.1 PAS domain S-box-containing protein [Duganella violaceicalia]
MAYHQNAIRVLVVEDEIVVSEDLQQRLRLQGYEVTGAADTAADAIRLATLTLPDVALMDIMLHGKAEGIEAAEYLRGQLDIPVIFLTAHSDAATLQRARLTDPAGYIVKPFDDAQLRVAIDMAPARHEMERKALRVARWLSATLTSIGDAVIATNTRAKIILLNPAAEKLTGWSQEQAVGQPFADVVRLVNHTTRLPLEDPATCALQQGLTIRIDPNTLLLTRTGEERFVDDSASPITDETGKILGAVVVIVDATDRHAVQGRVQGLARQVETLLAEKQRNATATAELEAFAAAVSHDLRGPLNAIAGFTYLLSKQHRKHLDSSGQIFLDHVQRNAREMISMTEDYLRFLGLSHGQGLAVTSVDLGTLVRDVFRSLTGVPGTKTVQFTCAPLPTIMADEAMLRQVFVNVLGNAIKYTSRQDQPVVSVGVSTAGPAAEAMHTLFVRDNGIGFDAAGAEKLFEPFQRFHSTAEFSGTGVGLSIVKRIVEHHGGTLRAQSQPGAGATFFLTLPARAVANMPVGAGKHRTMP